MTPFPPRGALSPVSDSDEYALWDAAYVLGSLSCADRREFEAHLSSCPSCRERVTELSGMPALLGQLDRDEVAAMDEGDLSAPPPLSPLLLTSLLAKVSRRRRRSRAVAWSMATAAAAVLAIGVLVAVQSHPAAPVPAAPRPDSSALTMSQVAPTPLNSTVTISSHGWGTHIEMNCTYGARLDTSAPDGDEPGDKLAMEVVGRDGSQSRLATWVALTGVTATPGGSTSMPIDQIAAVQIVSATSGDVFLQRSL
jgi:anti-sigma factor RsiW